MRTSTIRLFRNILVLLLMVAAGQGSAWATSSFTVSNYPTGSNTFRITRTGNTAVSETIDWRVVSLSALEGIHYTGVGGQYSGTATFNANDTYVDVTITETAPGTDAYKYQNGTSRKYRFEVLDKDGYILASKDRSITTGTSVPSSGIFTQKTVIINSGETNATDAGYINNPYLSVAGTSYYDNAAPKTWLSAIGATLHMTLSMDVKEVNDGYQYIQLLFDNTSSCDDRSNCSDGNPGNINLSRYMAGFGHHPGSYDGNWSTYTFPVTSQGNNCGQVDNPWGNSISCKLYNQKFKLDSYRDSDGKLIIPTSFTTLVLRLNASGDNQDTWTSKNVKAYIQAVDATAPYVLDNYKVSGGRHQKGNTFYISIPFSEIVKFTGTTRKLTTSWGDAFYECGDSTNVLTFKGTIADNATNALNITGLTGFVYDLAGNEYTGGISVNNLSTLDADYTWSTSDFRELATNTYEIYTKLDLRHLALLVNKAHNNCSGKTFKQTQDITCDTTYIPIGYKNSNSDYAQFQGTYDGQGHTVSGITVTRTGSNSYSNGYIGLFGYTNDCTVQNVVLANSTFTGSDYVGGIVGNAYSSNIINCRVENNVTIKAGTNNACYHGGIAGYHGGSSGRYVRGCISAASIQNNGKTGHEDCGGIVGQVSNSGTVKNCLYTGSTVEAASYKGAIVGNFASGTLTNNYYTSISLGGVNSADQDGARQARTVTLGDGVTLSGSQTAYSVSGLTAIGTTALSYDDGNSTTLYSGATQNLTLTYTGTPATGYQHLSYTVTDGTSADITATALSGSTLTMPADNVTVNATFEVIPWAGSGTDLAPWQIQYPSQLNLLADSVNNHSKTYEGKYFQQTADLVYDGTENNYTPVGDYGHQFKGNYNGGGHSVSGINVTRTGSGVAYNCVGLFGHLGNGAKVHNLTLASATLTGYWYVGGIAGWNEHGTVEDCRVESITINAVNNSASYHGGVVGDIINGTVAGCISAATVTHSSYSSCQYYGGIAGRNNGGTIRDCLYTGATVSGSSYSGSITGYNGTHINNYYTTSTLGGVNGSDAAGARQARTVTLGADVALIGSQTVYSLSGLTAIGTTALSYNDGNSTTLYSGATQNLTLSYTGSDPAPATGQHYSFGYNDGSDHILASNSLTMPAADVTVTYLGTAANTYTVQFKPTSKGSGTMADQAFTYGVAQNLTANAFTSELYLFSGWNTRSDGTGIAYTDGQSVSNLTADNGGTVTLFAQWTPDIATHWHADADHDGTTAERAYIITTTQGLDLLAALVNGGNSYSGTYFRLGADIAYSYTSAWNNASSTESNYTPIGRSSQYYFRGTFDGCGHTVSGIRIRLNDWNVGLFGFVNFGTVKNVTLADSRITGKKYTGGIVGDNNYGTVENCHAAATVALYAYSDDNDNFGGIVGYNNGTISGCTSTATVSNNGKTGCDDYGGIVGQVSNSGTVENCLALGTSVTADDYCGSVVGRNVSTITNCHYRNCSVNGVSQNDLYTVGGATGITVTPSGAPTTAYPYGGLEVHGTGIFYYSDTLYAVEDADVSLALHANLDAAEGYGDPIVSPSASSGTFSGSANPYALTMPAADVTISGSFTDYWGIADGADGTYEHPYLITTPEGLVLLSDRVNGGNDYYGTYFRLGNDIDMSGVANFNPIGYDYHFNGYFDGDRYTISHLTINKPDQQAVGLFGHLFGLVQNVTLDDAAVTGQYFVGAIVGLKDDGSIHNCVVLNSIVTATYAYAGAIVGFCPVGYSSLGKNYYHNCTVVRDGNSATSGIGTDNGDINEGGNIHNAVEGDLLAINVTAGQWQAIATPLRNGLDQQLALTDLIRGTCDLFSYDEYYAQWENQKTWGYLASARGYIYRSATSGTRTFYGIAFNEDYAEYGIGYRCGDAALKGFNLVGNPYNQPISFSDISVIPGNGAIAPGYYTLNPDGSWQAHTSGTIAPGQGFLLQATDEEPGQDRAIIRITKPAQSKGGDQSDQNNQNTLAFTVTDGEHSDVAYAILTNENDPSLIKFAGHTTTGSGQGNQKGLRKFGHQDVDLPSLSIAQGDGRYAIAPIAEEAQSFDLAFSGAPGEYTLSISNFQFSIFNYLHLIDRATGKDIDLLQQPSYTFTHSNTNTFSTRFLIKLSPVNSQQSTVNCQFAYREGDHLVIDGKGTLQVFDMLGRRLFTKELSTVNCQLSTSLFPATGVYILKLNDKTQKIVIR